jgi:hypothetical protein
MLIGCEHRYPRELRDLTPVEEKLMSLNAAYGFITKFNIQRDQLASTTYRKHVAGHITVFPNDVETLAATILPHPPVKALDQVHVIWTGPERLTLQDPGSASSKNTEKNTGLKHGTPCKSQRRQPTLPTETTLPCGATLKHLRLNTSTSNQYSLVAHVTP